MNDLTPAEFAAMLTAANIPYTQHPNTTHYLTRPEVATHLGVARGTLNRYRLPPPDVNVGNRPGWTTETINAWDSARPSRQPKRN